MRPSTLFFSCTMPEKLTRKAGLEVCRWLLHLVFDWERNTRSRQSLPVRECNIQALFSLYYFYTGCFQDKRFAHVGEERQTNITVFEPKQTVCFSPDLKTKKKSCLANHKLSP